MADRSSALVFGLHAVSVRGKFRLGSRKMQKDRGKIRRGGGGLSVLGLAFSLPGEVRFTILTVAKDRGPHEGN